MQECHVRSLGTIPYKQAWDLQNQLADQIAQGQTPSTLLLLEHPHTITFGRRGKLSNLLWDEAQLQQHGVQVYWVDRGGDVTYHGPGQLVGYPLMKLNIDGLVDKHHNSGLVVPKADYLGYLRNLEQVLINSLHSFGIQAGRHKDLTGVWVNRSKIAAIGVKVDARGITRHGFALNVAPDMHYWDSIIGCGLDGYTPASMAELLAFVPPMDEVLQAVVNAFEVVFAVNCRWIT